MELRDGVCGWAWWQCSTSPAVMVVEFDGCAVGSIEDTELGWLVRRESAGGVWREGGRATFASAVETLASWVADDVGADDDDEASIRSACVRRVLGV